MANAITQPAPQAPAGSEAMPDVQRTAIDPLTMMQQIIATGASTTEAVATIRELAQLHREMVADSARASWYRAMHRAQAEVPRVIKTGTNKETHSKFEKLDAVVRAAKPLLDREGFALVFGTEPSHIENWTRVIVDVKHVEGHSERYAIDAPMDTKGPKGGAVKTDLHGLGSTLTYIRKRLMLMVLNIEVADKGEDDDGNAGGGIDTSVVTPEQAATLLALAQEVGADIPRFLKWNKAESFAEIKAANYATAVARLEAKR